MVVQVYNPNTQEAGIHEKKKKSSPNSHLHFETGSHAAQVRLEILYIAENGLQLLLLLAFFFSFFQDKVSLCSPGYPKIAL